MEQLSVELQQIKAHIVNLVKQKSDARFEISENKQQICDIVGNGHTLLVQFYPTTKYLLFAIIEGVYREVNEVNRFVPPASIIEIIRLDAFSDSKDLFCWRNKENDLEVYNSIEITNIWVEKFFKKALTKSTND